MSRTRARGRGTLYPATRLSLVAAFKICSAGCRALLGYLLSCSRRGPLLPLSPAAVVRPSDVPSAAVSASIARCKQPQLSVAVGRRLGCTRNVVTSTWPSWLLATGSMGVAIDSTRMIYYNWMIHWLLLTSRLAFVVTQGGMIRLPFRPIREEG